MKTQEIHQEIIEAAARAFFVSAWADWQDGNGWPDGSPVGCDLMEIAPETPPQYIDHAKAWLEEWQEEMFSVDALARIFEILASEHRYGRGKDAGPAVFGHYAAMQAMGTGVGLWEVAGSYPERWSPPSTAAPEWTPSSNDKE